MKTSTLLTAVGYAKAPRATFFLKHPVKAVGAWMAWRAAKKRAPANVRKVAVAAGAVAATAVVAPLAAKAIKERRNG